MTAAVFLLIAAFAGVTIANREFAEPGPLPTDKVVIIERGSTTEDIVETLSREGVVARPSLLWAVLLWRDVSSKFGSDGASRRAKSGEYLFRQSASMSEVVEIITSGRSIQHAITIPEGLTSEQIVERLMQNELLTGEIASVPAEGRCCRTPTASTAAPRRIAHRAHGERAASRSQRNLEPPRQGSALAQPRELVTLASIVEKETGRADERPRVASVFYNRLDKKMRLQSDPTIIYGIVGGKATLGRPISRADIDRPTAYNTYTIPALPPGPSPIPAVRPWKRPRTLPHARPLFRGGWHGWPCFSRRRWNSITATWPAGGRSRRSAPRTLRRRAGPAARAERARRAGGRHNRAAGPGLRPAGTPPRRSARQLISLRPRNARPVSRSVRRWCRCPPTRRPPAGA